MVKRTGRQRWRDNVVPRRFALILLPRPTRHCAIHISKTPAYQEDARLDLNIAQRNMCFESIALLIAKPIACASAVLDPVTTTRASAFPTVHNDNAAAYVVSLDRVK